MRTLSTWWLLVLLSVPASALGQATTQIGPNSGVSFGQVDWPDLPTPAMDTGRGVMMVDLAAVRQAAGASSGYLNVSTGGRWVVRNLPVFAAQDYPYDQIMTYFPLGVPSGTDVSSIRATVLFSTGLLTGFPASKAGTIFGVGPQPLNLGGLPQPIAAPPPDPVDSAIPKPALDHASAQVIQQGHPNVNAARNQCMPMAIANSLQFLENTTDLELPQAHVPGLAPNGNSDGSLVGDVEAETTRAASVTSRTNAGATGTWGLNGKLKFLAKNGLQDDIRTRHFGHIGNSPNGDFASGNVTQTVNGKTASSQPFGKTVSIADLINSMRDGEDCELVYTYEGGGSHAVDLAAAGISGGLPWTVTVSDLQQTNQHDPSDNKLGPGQGFEFSLMSDRDGDGFLEFPDGRRLVTAYCEKYVGTPPQTAVVPLDVTGVDDPAGHRCCVAPPGSTAQITWDGSDLLIDAAGDGFPLRGWIEASGDFYASSISPVAGFPAVYSYITGRFDADGNAQGAKFTIGALGELFNVPIAYTLDIGTPSSKLGAITGKAAAESTGGLFRVNQGETLTVPSGNAYLINGFLYNEGTIVISNNAALRNDGMIENRGSIQVNGQLEGKGTLGGPGNLVNNGTILQEGLLQLAQQSSARNQGTWQVGANAQLASSGSLENNGTLRLMGRMANRGSMNGSGRIEISQDAELDNFETLNGKVTNNGRLLNLCDASLGANVSGHGVERVCLLAATPSGLEQMPMVESTHVGNAEFSLDVDGAVLDYALELPGLDLDGSQTPNLSGDDVTSVQIRRGAAGEIGTPAVDLLTDGDLVVDAARARLRGRWDGNDTSPLNATLVQRLLDGTLYLEVSTGGHGSGELRGQIRARGDASPGKLIGDAALGMLYDRARNGHGMDFQRAGDNYFLTFFSYGADGAPEWYLAIGRVIAGVFGGELYRFGYDGADSPPQTGTSVGRAVLDFSADTSAPGCDDGTDRANALSVASFHWEIDSQSGNWCVEPLIVGGSPPMPDFTGHWYAGSSDEGWGLTIYQQGSVLFAVLYFYDAAGNPRWMLGSSNSFHSGDTLTMDEYSGYCRSCAFGLGTSHAGTLILTFNQPSQQPNGNAATINVTYQGPEGGSWVRNQVPIQLLSDPAD